MPTVKLREDELERYFDTFTRHFLKYDSTQVADVEVETPTLGNQIAANGARLLGVTFDPRTRSLELSLEAGDHRIEHPTEVWVDEEEDGFVTAIAAARPDGTREIIRLRRLALRKLS